MTVTDDAPRHLTDEEIAAALAEVPAPEAIPLEAPEEVKPKRTRTRTRAATTRTRTRAAAADRAPRTRTKTATRATVADSVRGVYEMTGAVILPLMGRPAAGAHVAQLAPEAAEAWALVAEKYPAVARLFSAGDGGLVFIKLLMVHLPLLATIRAESAALGGTPEAEPGGLAASWLGSSPA